jgi:uracil-DNA glycosylase
VPRLLGDERREAVLELRRPRCVEAAELQRRWRRGRLLRRLLRLRALTRPAPGLDSPAVSAVPLSVDDLEAYAAAVAPCTRCRLAQGRTQVVFGAGNPHADLMFVGEAPGFHEDKQGLPFVGQAGKLLEKLLAEIGMSRQDVYIANVLKCRPPGNRDPQPDEIEACESHLFRQIELIEPTIVATLGNFATKLLSGRPLGITRVHGQEQQTTLGGREVTLYPLYHPAAALYTPAMLKVLESDFARIPELLGRALSSPEPELVSEAAPPAEQLGLF